MQSLSSSPRIMEQSSERTRSNTSRRSTTSLRRLYCTLCLRHSYCFLIFFLPSAREYVLVTEAALTANKYAARVHRTFPERRSCQQRTRGRRFGQVQGGRLHRKHLWLDAITSITRELWRSRLAAERPPVREVNSGKQRLHSQTRPKWPYGG